MSGARQAGAVGRRLLFSFCSGCQRRSLGYNHLTNSVSQSIPAVSVLAHQVCYNVVVKCIKVIVRNCSHCTMFAQSSQPQ